MRNTYVPPTGPRDADIMIVGEQPGKREVQQRRPFVGPAGMELDKCLQAARIVRSQCYLTNVFKDLDCPLNHYLEHKKSGTYLSKDGEVYLEELKKEIESINPNIIIGVGNVPLYALAGRWGITNWRGSILESTLVRGKKVITTFHPATVIPPKMQYLNERLIIFDLIRAREESSFEEIRRVERNIRINPTYFEAVEFLNKCFEEGLRGSLINFDIEVYREEVSCISFAYNEFESMSIPFIGFEGDYFDVSQETEIWKLIAKILEDERIKKLNQNIAFDSAYLLQYVGIKVKNVEDTMIAQKILYPDYPAGLDFITSTYTDIPYYKGEGKKWFKLGGGWKQLWHYNGLDSIACKAAFPKQLVDLDKQKNLETYKRQRNIIEPLVFMMTRGIKVDVEGLFKRREEMIKEYDKTLNELNEIAGCELNPKAPKQLSWYFYTKLGLKPYMKNGRVTTDDKALSRLARKGVREAALIQRLRHLNKITSTYITERKISDDGRIRCSYNPVGAKTGRLSSSEDIHGRGMNLQNWPHDLLTYLIADEGYVFYNVDLSQAENRIVAYVGRVERMIQAFENEEDVHKLTAGLIFNKPPNEISSEDFSSGIGSYSERFIGKKSNHSLNYDLGYRNFSLLLQIPENQGKWLVNRYHSIYPEIRNNYHAIIRAQLRKDRTLTNLMGRKRLFLQQWGDALFKDAYSHIPQSTVADIISERGLSYTYNKFDEVILCMQVHDSIAFLIPLSLNWNEHARILLNIKEKLETPLNANSMEFVIPADFKIGINLGSGMREIKHAKMPSDIKQLGELLEFNYKLLVQ